MPFPSICKSTPAKVSYQKHQLLKEAVPWQASARPSQSLLTWQAAIHAYTFSSSSCACLLLLCMAAIYSL